MKDVRGNFGNSEVKTFPCTFGMNSKGGMDKDEFNKYIFVNIVPLYPDVVDVLQKRVLIELDSGLGQMNVNLMARLRNLGFYVYPGGPNTSSVSQEIDRKYGRF